MKGRHAGGESVAGPDGTPGRVSTTLIISRDNRSCVIIPRRKKKSLFGMVVKGAVAIIVLWLVIVLAFPFFEHWAWLKFFLICAVGMGFLGITYLLRTC